MERTTIVRVHEGLHARPATRFVKLAKSFDCDVEILKAGKTASAKSSVKLMLLSVKENDELTLRADGSDAGPALDALVSFLQDPGSGLEGDDVPVQKPVVAVAPASPPLQVGAMRGVAASEGVALARVHPHFPRHFVPTGRRLAGIEIEAERRRFQDALMAVQSQMDRELARPDLSQADHSILRALSDMAGDPAILDEIHLVIGEGADAVDAVLQATSSAATAFSRLPDAYLNARADDVLAIGRQFCLALAGERDTGLDAIAEPAIIVAEDIGAWDLARAPLKLIRGLVCGHGGATSHVAIIARAHGIPAVLGLGEDVTKLRQASHAAIDGHNGDVFADPGDSTREYFEARIRIAELEEEALQAYRDIKPHRPDGTIIEVAANIGSIEEIEAARQAGAMGIGLFRTELLFMKHGGLPTEDMQAEVYAQAARAFAPDPVIIRTLDIGGDKPVAGIVFPEEANPFLGWRGVRMCLDRPDVFKPQLKALLRAAVHGNLKVMLPMVSTVEEIAQTRVMIEECKRELDADNKVFGDFSLGVMIETPAAVFIARELAQHVDFFSIGTNDLTQYVMAADRLNPKIAALNDVANPAVQAAIEMVAKAAGEAGIMVGMCGEAAAMPDLIPHFVSLGLTELSMSPASIPRAKKVIETMRL